MCACSATHSGSKPTCSAACATADAIWVTCTLGVLGGEMGRTELAPRPAVAQDRKADLRVRPHQCPLGFVERRVLSQDLVWDAALADVVQQTCSRQDP